nr:hypothetical protein [Tanacetum cinerariifolium]
PDHEARSAHLAEAFGDHPRFSDQNLCALTPNMLYAQAQAKDDMLCRRQDDMSFLPPSFRECVLIRGWSPLPAHFSAGGMLWIIDG